MLKLREILSIVGSLAVAGLGFAADAPNFEKDVQPLLDRYCYSCHSGNRPRQGVRLEKYDDLFKGKRKLVVAGEPDDSRLIKTMLGKGGKKMPPRKEERQPSDKEIDLIKEWIKAGAKDDAPPESNDKKGSGSDKGSAPEKGSGSGVKGSTSEKGSGNDKGSGSGDQGPSRGTSPP
jgi:hypothetical protein